MAELMWLDYLTRLRSDDRQSVTVHDRVFNTPFWDAVIFQEGFASGLRSVLCRGRAIGLQSLRGTCKAGVQSEDPTLSLSLQGRPGGRHGDDSQESLSEASHMTRHYGPAPRRRLEPFLKIHKQPGRSNQTPPNRSRSPARVLLGLSR